MFYIRDIAIDTKTEQGKLILGNYYEQKLYNYLKRNSKYNYEMISKNDIYSLYDFKAIENDKIRIIELRSRIGNIENYKYEIFHIEKYQRLKNLYNSIDIIEVLLIFCHINPDNYKDYKFYYVDIKDLKPKDYKINTKFNKEMYEIPKEILKEF